MKDAFVMSVPVWIAFAMIAWGGWWLAGWLGHQFRIYRAYREYRRFNQEMRARRQEQAWRGLSRMGER